MNTTASMHINRKNRKLIRRKIKKGFLNEAKKKIAQRAIEEAYQKRINATSIFDIASKEELKEIIYIAETNLPFIRLFEEKLSEDIYSGKYTNTQSKINKILKECNAVNNSGMLKESWAEFGLDMLFGLGPAIGDALAAPTGGASAIAGRGLAIAGMIYYGHKLAMAYKRNNTMDVFIHGLSFMFSAAAVFPAVGSAMAWVGKSVVTAIKAIFGPIFKGLAFGGKAVISGGASVKGAVVKKVSEKFLNPKVVENLTETGAQLAKHSDKIKSMAGMTETGLKYIDEFVGLAMKLKPVLGKIPFVGSKLGPILDDMLTILPKVSKTLSSQAGAMGKVAAVAEKEGLEAVATGALASKAVATTAAEVKVATDVLETLAKDSPELAAAAKKLGYLDEGFEAIVKQSNKIGKDLGGDTFRKSKAHMAKIVSDGLGKGSIDDIMKGIASHVDEMGPSMSIYGQKAATVAFTRGYTSLYKGLLQGLDDVAKVTGTTIEKVLASSTVKLKGGSAVKNIIVAADGKMMAAVITKDGTPESIELTAKMMSGSPWSDAIKTIGISLKGEIAKKTAAIEARIAAAATTTAEKAVAKEATEEVAKVTVTATAETTEVITKEITEEVAKLTDEVAEGSGSALNKMLSPEAWKESADKRWFDMIGSSYKTVIDSISTSHSSAPGAGSYNLQRESLLNNAIRLMEKRERIKNRQRKYTSLKLLY